MKTAIYSEDGVTQLVFSPETDFERAALKTLEGKTHSIEAHSGSFKQCVGGYFRQYPDTRDTMLITRPLPPQPTPPDFHEEEGNASS